MTANLPLLLLLPGGLVIWGALALRATRLIGRRRTYCAWFWASLYLTVIAAATIGVGWVALYAFNAVGCWWCWRNARDDDDDDRWKRLLAWGKSKIPRPTIRYHRPALRPAPS